MYKRFMRLIALAGLMVAISGCATTAERDPGASSWGIDSQRVSQINRAASRAGVKVIWLNPPRAKQQRVRDPAGS